jgi:transposase
MSESSSFPSELITCTRKSAVVDLSPLIGSHPSFANTLLKKSRLNSLISSQNVSFDNNTLLVIENTGIYHRLIWKFCSTHQLPIHIGNAAHIKWSFGIARGKNDTIDSQRLCKYAYKHADELKASSPLNPVFIKLRDLMTSRSRLSAQVGTISSHLKELSLSNNTTTQKLIEQAHKPALNGLKKSVALIEKQILKIIDQDPTIKINYDLLITVPGIGHLTAVYILCCTNNFVDKITGKQLACYAGIVPFQDTSGSSIKGRNKVHTMANNYCLLFSSCHAYESGFSNFRRYFFKIG